MECLNCGKPIPDDAEICQFCEAAIGPEPTAEEIEAVQNMLAQMDPEAIEQLRAAFEQSTSAEDFANRIMVGPCPRCGSDETGDCGLDPEIDDISVGRCLKCGQLWCTLCDKLLDKSSPVCKECEEEFDDDELDDELDDEAWDDEELDEEDERG